MATTLLDATQPKQTAAPKPEPRSFVQGTTVPADGPSEQDIALVIMRKPFEAHQISKMCKSTKKDNQPGRCKDCGGWHKLPSVQLSYVGHAALTDRLLEADPRWTWEPMALAPNGTPLLDADGGMWIRLTVAGVTRLGYGDAQGKTGGDATKERIGDALRNAAMRFGAALELWHKGDLHAPEEAKEEEAPTGMTNGELKEQVDEIGRCETLAGLDAAFKAAAAKALEAKNMNAYTALKEAKDKRKKGLAQCS
jgi:hypothetical protein